MQQQQQQQQQQQPVYSLLRIWQAKFHFDCIHPDVFIQTY
jgi:hypothetical protein